jgi:hypothetical protein
MRGGAVRKIFVGFLIGATVLGLGAQEARRMFDDSDWWSADRSSYDGTGPEPQKRELPPANFRILGIVLGEKMFKEAAAKLGATDQIQRGDASTGRIQACYVSNAKGDKVHLIFEQGEVDYTFHLFVDGPSWKGDDSCTPTKALTLQTKTGAGLHLGMTRNEVVAALGKPSKHTPEEIQYSMLVQKANKAQNPKGASYYDLGEGILAKFKNGRLVYISASRAETD